MSEITAVVLTKDEEAYIADCLASLKWCDEVLVIDSISSDRTTDIVHQLGAKVVYHLFQNFSDQRTVAIDLVESEWILFVDADERVTPELGNEIREAIQDPGYDGWWNSYKEQLFWALGQLWRLFPGLSFTPGKKDKDSLQSNPKGT